MRAIIRRLLGRQPEGYRCHHVVLHFPDAEQAAAYTLTLPAGILHEARILRGGEMIPRCEVTS